MDLINKRGWESSLGLIQNFRRAFPSLFIWKSHPPWRRPDLTARIYNCGSWLIWQSLHKMDFHLLRLYQIYKLVFIKHKEEFSITILCDPKGFLERHIRWPGWWRFVVDRELKEKREKILPRKVRNHYRNLPVILRFFIQPGLGGQKKLYFYHWLTGRPMDFCCLIDTEIMFTIWIALN